MCFLLRPEKQNCTDRRGGSGKSGRREDETRERNRDTAAKSIDLINFNHNNKPFQISKTVLVLPN